MRKINKILKKNKDENLIPFIYSRKGNLTNGDTKQTKLAFVEGQVLKQFNSNRKY
jgi:hypothetical protein